MTLARRRADCLLPLLLLPTLASWAMAAGAQPVPPAPCDAAAAPAATPPAPAPAPDAPRDRFPQPQPAAAPPAAAAACPAPAPTATLRLERALGAGTVPGTRRTPVYVRAEQAEGEDDEHVHLRGAVELRHGGAVVRGDQLDYDVAGDEVQVRGHVRLAQNNAVFEGPSLDLRLEAHTGSMPQASYVYQPNQGRGESRLVEFLGEDEVRLHQASYTTCRPGEPAWWIKAETLDLDRVDQEAVGHNTTLYFEGVPVLASPYFDLPLGDQRRSGLLTPGYAGNTRVGQEFLVPYYWNIAPNRDLTITPDFLTRRGVLLGSEFRFLEPFTRGVLQYDVIPNDRSTNTQRDHISLQQDIAAGDGLTAGINYNRVSDDTYLLDYAHNIVTSAPSVLPQEGFITYAQTYWSGTLRVSQSQVLQSLLAAGDPGPYRRVPDLTVHAGDADWHGFDIGTAFEATRFEHPTLEWGNRVVVNPSLSYPLLSSGAFLVPRLQWHYTDYQLDPDFHDGADHAVRSLPMASIDGGLVLERPATLFGNAVTQTLEPRVYYARVPYRDQHLLPNFDSTDADFNFPQIFNENVFTGSDRIAEANQVTTAATSRLLDDASGAERARVALGQRYYFGPQRVTLPGETPRTKLQSDILFAASASAASAWSAQLGLDYSTVQSEVVRASVGLRWQPRAASVVNFTYRFQTALLDQIGVSAQWPLGRRWYGVGNLNYSIAGHGWVETLGGVEYKADCWVGRFVVQRYSVDVSNYTTAWFFQVELNGLTSIGTSPLDQLQRSIPGFQRINPRPAPPGPYDHYE